MSLRSTPRGVWLTIAGLVLFIAVVGAIKSNHPPETAAVTTTSSTTTAEAPTAATSAPSSTISTTALPTTAVTTVPPTTALPDTTPTTVAGVGRSANRPDPTLTPGATFANVAAGEVCVSGYSSTVRNVPQSEKDQVFSEYDVPADMRNGTYYEVDHLISLELGGSNDITNLWPEPYTGTDNAHDKDTIENRLHSMVCAGSMTLPDAQAAILHWWDYE